MRRTTSLIIGLIGLLATTASVNAQELPVPRGNYAVGFRSYVGRDFSRAWQGLAKMYKYRPVLLRIWYPSSAAPRSSSMTLLGYLAEPSESGDPTGIVRAQHAYSHRSLSSAVSNDAPALAHLLRTPLLARWNAPARAGKFPLVVYSLGQNDYLEENAVLCEILASYGFVVVTVPDLGTNERRNGLFIDDPESYETQVRDLEFALAALVQNPFVDSTRVGAVGHSMGGIYALLLAMRHPEIRSVAGLDPTYISKRAAYEFDQKKLAYYDSLRFRAPLMVAYRASESVVLDDVTALVNSDRYLYRFPKAIHADFNAYAWLTRNVPLPLLDAYALTVRSPAEGAANYRVMTATLVRFMQETAAGIAPTLPATVPGAWLTEFKTRNTPDPEQLGALVAAGKAAEAEQLLQAAVQQYPGQPIVPFRQMNRIGYEFLYTNRAPLAVQMFRLNTIANPTAASFESFGEGLEAVKDIASAMTAYRKALELDPTNSDAKSALARLQKAPTTP